MRISSDVRFLLAVKLGIAPGIGKFKPCSDWARRIFSGVRVCRRFSGFFIISASSGLLRAISWYSGMLSIICRSYHRTAPTIAITSGCSWASCSIICIDRSFSKPSSTSGAAACPAPLDAPFSRPDKEAIEGRLAELVELVELVELAELVTSDGRAELVTSDGRAVLVLGTTLVGAGRGVGVPHRFGTTVWLEAPVEVEGLEKPF